MIHHPIAHLINGFLGDLAALIFVSLLAVKAETAPRQWPWLVGWGAALLITAVFWGAESFLANCYLAGIHKP